MIDQRASDAVNQAVCYELQNIVKKYGAAYASEHEAYAVLLEEKQEAEEALRKFNCVLDKLWECIRNNKIDTDFIGACLGNAIELAQEAVQCAAVCERFLETIK